MSRLLFLLLPALFFFSCGEDDQKDVLFEMAYRIDFEIPAGLNVVEDHFFQFKGINSRLDSLLNFHGYTREDIGAINPKSAVLTSEFVEDEYDFVRESSVYIFTEEVNNLTYEAFWRTEIPQNTRSILELPATLIDARDFFLEPKFNIEIRFDTRTTTTTFVGTKMELIFVVRRK